MTEGRDPGFLFTAFDFSGLPVSVSAGTMLALTLRYTGVSPDIYVEWGNSNDPYATGHAWNNRKWDAGWALFSGIDYGFRTYVDASEAPIPPALWLFGSGLLGLIGISKRK